MKRIILIVIVALVALGLGYGLVGLLSKKSTTTKTNITPAQNGVETNAAAVKDVSAILEKAQKTDSDLDGLTNQEEITAKTDPSKVDSDGDGVSDFDEVKTFLTNPLKTDSLNTGYNDSWAIQRGIITAGGVIHKDLLKKYSN